jgi:hypothetical protein
MMFRNIHLKVWFIVLVTFFSCQKKEIFTKEKLIGKWQTIDKKHPVIILEINKNSVSRFENGEKKVYNSYMLSEDTLILENSKVKEKHLIEISTNTKLRFGAINPYQKDVELIDAVEFIKKPIIQKKEL